MSLKLQARIRRARRHAGLSQAALAARIDVRRSAVSNWESASGVSPSMQNLAAIAVACGVSLEWLGLGRSRMLVDGPVDIPAADAELVDATEERHLLELFRNMPRRSQQLVLELADVLQARARRRRPA